MNHTVKTEVSLLRKILILPVFLLALIILGTTMALVGSIFFLICSPNIYRLWREQAKAMADADVFYYNDI